MAPKMILHVLRKSHNFFPLQLSLTLFFRAVPALYEDTTTQSTFDVAFDVFDFRSIADVVVANVAVAAVGLTVSVLMRSNWKCDFC